MTPIRHIDLYKCIEIPGRRQGYFNGDGLTIHLDTNHWGANGHVKAWPLSSSVGGGGQGVGNPPPLRDMFFVSWMLAGTLVLKIVQMLRKIRVAVANFNFIGKVLLDRPLNSEQAAAAILPTAGWISFSQLPRAREKLTGHSSAQGLEAQEYLHAMRHGWKPVP